MKKNIVYGWLVGFALTMPFAVNAKEICSNYTLNEDVSDGIIIKSGCDVTLDLANHNITNTNNNDTIIIESGAKATIKGNGKTTNTFNGKAVIKNDGTLVIEDGEYYRVDESKNSYYVILNHGDMTINGGKIKVTNGTSSLIDNGWYYPEDNSSKKMSSLVINGGTFEMSNNNKYIKNDDYGIMTVNGGTFNMNIPSSAIIANVGSYSGNELLTVNNGTFNYVGTNYAIWGYAGKTVINGGTYKLSDDSSKISNIALAETTNEYTTINGDIVIAEENTIAKKVEVETINADDISSEELNLIVNAIEQKYEIAGYYNIELFNTVNETIKLEKISESSNQVKVTINIPNTISKVKDGYKREYYIIRVHDGKTDILPANDNGNGTISFNTDKFSTYTLVYNDVEEKATNNIENPKTFDVIIVYIIIAILSIIGIITTGSKLKKRMN